MPREEILLPDVRDGSRDGPALPGNPYRASAIVLTVLAVLLAELPRLVPEAATALEALLCGILAAAFWVRS